MYNSLYKFALSIAFTFLSFIINAQYQANIKVEPLLKTDTTSIGQKINFQDFAEDEITILKITIPPGESTGWHKHIIPVFALIHNGTLTVELESGKKLVFTKNTSFSEVFNLFHNGTNTGTEDVVLTAIYLGEKGKALSVKKEWKKPNPFGLNILQDTADYMREIHMNPELKLVDLTSEIQGVQLDLRYATVNNFTGNRIYTMPKAYLRAPAARALKKVQDSLAYFGLALKIFDAYRPYSASLVFAELISDTSYVASPRKGSRHNRGCAVDVSLVNKRTGKELAMPTGFDDFSEKAGHSYMKLPRNVIKNRELLSGIMKHFGFYSISSEWWHYDFQGWQNIKLMDLSFEELSGI
jgi:D-alanyl-D-alanine dipeptidase